MLLDRHPFTGLGERLLFPLKVMLSDQQITPARGSQFSAGKVVFYFIFFSSLPKAKEQETPGPFVGEAGRARGCLCCAARAQPWSPVRGYTGSVFGASGRPASCVCCKVYMR